MLYAEDRRVSNARPPTPSIGVRPGAGMSTTDRAKINVDYQVEQHKAKKAKQNNLPPKPAKKSLSYPITKEINKPNFLARAYNALLNVPTVAPAGVGVPSKANNPLAQTVEPSRVAVRRAVGDFTAIPGVGKPSASPTATDIKQGNYVGPVIDYGNLALTAAGFRATGNRPVYGVHSSPVPGLKQINPRAPGQKQFVAGDSVVGSSYMWDAKSPYVGTGEVLFNPQMNLKVPHNWLLDAPPVNTLYLTKSPRRSVIADANIPKTPGLRVRGQQQVISELPIDREALGAALRSFGINPRSNYVQNLIQQSRTLSPSFLRSAAQRARWQKNFNRDYEQRKLALQNPGVIKRNSALERVQAEQQAKGRPYFKVG